MTKDEHKIKIYNKWSSRRWIITVWSMLMISILSILGLLLETDNYSILCTSLVAIPVAFTSLETLNKKWKKENEDDCSETIN